MASGTIKVPAPMMIVEMVNGGSLSTNSSGYYIGTFSAAKEGYVPIGAVGYTMSTSFVYVPTVQIDGTDVKIEVRDVSNGVRSFNPKVWVLYRSA